jgi:bacterioferritin-associated ferredoxin
LIFISGGVASRSMLVCHCERVSECEVREAVASGAGSVQEVARRCGAGRQCGGCHPLIDEILDDAAPRDRRFEPLPLARVA